MVLRGRTAVCAVLFIKNKVVAVRNPRGWDIPGGHLEKEESPYTALRREKKIF
jgi:8-oxo-dGTP pyrophosphatase MutT (NUDIX family)